MEVKPFDLKISDLPSDIELSVSEVFTGTKLNELLESLKSQIIYNSRYEETAPENVSIKVVESKTNSLKLKAEKAA